MDSAERGGDSSSPSAKVQIVSIAKEGARRGESCVLLSDGSSFFVLTELLETRGLLAGDELTPEQVEQLQSQSAALAAEKKALSLLANAPHSQQALRMKLLQRGFDEEAVQSATQRLQEMGYLDDRRFAESWVSARLARHPEGAALLAAGLIRRGVGRAMAEEVVREALGPQTEEDGVRKAAERLLRSRPLDREQLLRRLTARGFRTSVAIRVVDELLGGR